MEDTAPDEPQETPQNYPMSYGATPYDTYNSSIILLTSTEAQIEKMRLALLGLEEDANGQIVQTAEPLMNDRGVKYIIELTRTYANRNVKMGFYEESQVNRLLQDFGENLVRHLAFSGYAYGIKDFSTRTFILDLSLNTVLTCFQRGLKEGERKFWKSNFQEVRTQSIGDKKSFKMPFGLGRK